jgi:hypothetical protein
MLNLIFLLLITSPLAKEDKHFNAINNHLMHFILTLLTTPL